MAHIFKLKPCLSCNGTRLQVQTEGVLKGVIRFCPDCYGSWRLAKNLYGEDIAEHPEVYVDSAQGIIEKVDRRKDYILINGKDVPLK